MKPQDYKAAITMVEDAFPNAGIVLTGSVARLLGGEGVNTNTYRWGYDMRTGIYTKEPSESDIDVVVVAPVKGLKMRAYLFDSRTKLMNLPPEYRNLLDMVVLDEGIFPILEELGGLKEKYAKGARKEDVVALRRRRLDIVNRGVISCSNPYAQQGQTFLDASAIPYNLGFSHTVAIGGGHVHQEFGNDKMNQIFIDLSAGAYLPEEIGEKNAEAQALRKLKTSRVNIMDSKTAQTFTMAARKKGFDEAEQKAGRRFRGMWDPLTSADLVRTALDYLRIHHRDMYDMVYRQA
ncbi:MAG TPA: hypothetical protein VI979_00710 [archaeon]|nr:hypothetical protein [archaeon]